MTLQSHIKLERRRQWCLLANVLTEKHLAKNRRLSDKVHSVTPAI
jgi:hypothetical protein